MEYIARSSSAIADVASFTVSRGRASEVRRQHGFGLPDCITLDVPSLIAEDLLPKKLRNSADSVTDPSSVEVYLS